MEQPSRKPEGDNEHDLGSDERSQSAAYRLPQSTRFEFGYLSPLPPEGDSWDAWVIERGIAVANEEDRAIDDRTAHYIAAQLRENQATALYSLASTGNVEEPRIHQELTRRIYDQPEQVQQWITRLGEYCLQREDKGPVDDWLRLIADQDRAELETMRREQAAGQLDGLFGEQPAEAIGSAQELGWFGLVRHHGRPGGLILSQDEQGFRRVWETDADDELQERWSAINEDYAAFYHDSEQEHEQSAQPGRTDTSSTNEVATPERLKTLDERLAELLGLGDIPRPPGSGASASGYEWIEQLPRGWHAEPVWGRDGWDLGVWPLVVVALFIDEEADRYAIATYTEGDVTVKPYQSRDALHVAVNEIAEFHWRLGQSLGPDDLPERQGLLAKHCGPYSAGRREREIAAEARYRRTDEQGEPGEPDPNTDTY